MSSILSKLINLAGNITGTLPAVNGGLATNASAFTGVVKASSGAFSAATIVDADVSSSAAIAGSKITAADATNAGTVPSYEAGSFLSSTSGPFTTSNITVTYTRIGKAVTLCFSSKRSTGNSTASTISFAMTNMPSTIRPLQQTYYSVLVTNTTDQISIISAETSGSFIMYGTAAGANFASTASTVGFYAFATSYVTA